MEDFGDILFFVIAGIIGIISSIAGKKKKQQAGQGQAAPKRSIAEELEDLFEPEKKPAQPMRAETAYESVMEALEDFPDVESVMEERPTASSEHAERMEKRNESRTDFDPQKEGVPSLTKVLSAEDRMDLYLNDMITDNTGKDLQVEEGIGLQERDSFAKRVAIDFNLSDAIIYSEILTPRYF